MPRGIPLHRAASNVADLEMLIHYTFTNKALGEEALTAPGASVAGTGHGLSYDGNKRLALYGDAILKVALVDDWYPTHQSRGYFNVTVMSAAANDNLDAKGRQCGLVDLVYKNPGATGVAYKVMTAAVEAVIGAVWLDSNSLDTVKTVMIYLGLTIPGNT